MKKLIVLAFCTLVCGVVVAQEGRHLSLGVKAGLNIPDLTTNSDNPLSNGWSSSLGPQVGITAEYSFSEKFSLVSGLNWTVQGGKKDGMQAIPTKKMAEANPAMAGMIGALGNPKYFYADFDNKTQFNYLELPVMARYTWKLSDKWEVFANGGLYVAYMMKAKQISEGASQLYLDENGTPIMMPTPAGPMPFSTNIDLTETRNITDKTEKFNFGVMGGAGVGFGVWKGTLELNITGSYGLLNIQKSDENGQNRIGAGTVTLGYAFDIF